MNIKTELIKSSIIDKVCSRITDFEVDESKVADSKAIEVLAEIQKILKSDEEDDFLIVDSIVEVFIKHNLDFGSCHDF
ncbi:MAG: hypothetical protein IKW62_06010 [Clostridia bacterium]|nr:hypothetical protein [Clostridia bacterium]